MIKMLPPTAKIKSEEEYDSWLNSLKEGDLALYQRFEPRYNGLFGIGYEFWNYAIVRVAKNDVQKSEIMTKGRTFSFESSKKQHFLKGTQIIDTDIFHSRLVKLVPELLPKDFDIKSYKEYDVDYFGANLPIYEPDFRGLRIFLLKPQLRDSDSDLDKKMLHQLGEILATFPSYTYEVIAGEITVCFPGEELSFNFQNWLKENNIDLLRYLYAENLWISDF